MANQVTVLFSSVGRRVALVECFRRAAQELGVPLKTVGVDLNPSLSAACQLVDASFSVPRSTDPEFISSLLKICDAERVNLLVPTIDTELEVLAENREKFYAIGTQIAVSCPETVRMARNKLVTHGFLSKIGIVSPRTAKLSKLLERPESWRFPVILKPVDGSSSIGLHVCRSIEAVRRAELPLDSYIAQELWVGKEYTVNLFFDPTSLRCAVPHLRCETRAGEVSKGVTQRLAPLLGIAQRLGEALKSKAFGALCFQAILQPDGQIGLFEINARFGGGYPLADHAGATFAKWLLEIVLGRPCSGHENWRENVLMLRYDAATFHEEVCL
ncbi:MAG TPA: ATP-grasp domain-containing protein [Verrucomicrobiae bacterium]|nr:ATP-grasp domain-containing protein [Verrucomicrobiae bacterium]